MFCPQQISHIIRQGDNLYHLAMHYRTTVADIISHNPGIDPYNLKIGSSVIICPGDGFLPQPGNPPAMPDFDKQMDLINNMRVAWMQHVYWTRMLIISIAEKLKDQPEVAERLLQNPHDIMKNYEGFYAPEVINKIAQLLNEHLQIGGNLITALRDNKTAEAEELSRRWYMNADQIADAFANVNPYYNREELRRMLYNHLELTSQEVAMRLAGNYQADIEAFNKVEQEALSMADFFASGLLRQFPQKFY